MTKSAFVDTPNIMRSITDQSTVIRVVCDTLCDRVDIAVMHQDWLAISLNVVGMCISDGEVVPFVVS
ncbi:MAG TPA: hypothetical protein VF069_01665 [Streptosporangiaceae bacterium]